MSEQPQSNGANRLPFGNMPNMQVQHKIVPQFDPATLAALRDCRENRDGRFLILIFRADELDAGGNTTVHLHTTTGKSWNRMWWMLAWECFMQTMLKPPPPPEPIEIPADSPE